MSTSAALADKLIALIREYESCAVAFSAGVDSTVVLQAAHLALGDRAVGVIGVGPALAEGELEQARQLAQQMGARLVEIATDEIHQPGYIANASDRCYHCKTELYTHVAQVAKQHQLSVIANGANVDDQGDYRPGMKAAAEFEVRSPLLESELTKADVRALATHWNLPVADKPAAPCLASRLAYGVEVTPERLQRVDAAEQLLRSLGWREVRVRYHDGDLARLEVPAAAIPQLAEESVRTRLVDELTQLGFRYVTLDLAGFRSGSLNAVLPENVTAIETIGIWK